MARSTLPAELAPGILESLRARFAAYPLIQDWAVTIDELAPGRTTMSLGPSRMVLNLMGTVHGGVLASLSDMACAVALSSAFEGTMPFATSDLHIRYLEPAEGRVTAEAQVVRLSPRGAILDCRLLCGTRLVALCTTHFAIKPKGRQDSRP